MLGAVGGIAGTMVNAVQRGQEKDRQERMDEYNKKLNDRNYIANLIQNNPTVQMQRLKDAGVNPLAQGFTPDIQSPVAGTSTLSANPVETSSVGGTLAQSLTSAYSTLQEAKNIEIRQQELERAKEELRFKQNLEKANKLIEAWNNGSMSHTEAGKHYLNSELEELGYSVRIDDDGNAYLNEERQIEKLEAETENIRQKTETEKYTTEITKEERVKAFIDRLYYSKEKDVTYKRALQEYANSLQEGVNKKLTGEALVLKNAYQAFDNLMKHYESVIKLGGVDKLSPMQQSFFYKAVREKGFEQAFKVQVDLAHKAGVLDDAELIEAYEAVENITQGNNDWKTPVGRVGVGLIKAVKHWSSKSDSTAVMNRKAELDTIIQTSRKINYRKAFHKRVGHSGHFELNEQSVE